MDYQKIYKEKYAEAVRKNYALVRKQLRDEDPSLMDKIQKRSAEYNIPIKTIIKEIQQYKTAVIPFVKSPARQNFYEKTAASMIRAMDGVCDFKELPNDKLFICQGAVIKKEDLKQYPTAKTLDFEWAYKKYKIYAYHKYTKQGGGTQDTQYKDLQSFIKESRDTKLRKTIFVAMADGDYYLTENGRAGMSRIENLESLCTNKIIACRMENLKQKLDIICK